MRDLTQVLQSAAACESKVLPSGLTLLVKPMPGTEDIRTPEGGADLTPRQTADLPDQETVALMHPVEETDGGHTSLMGQFIFQREKLHSAASFLKKSTQSSVLRE